MHKSSELDRIRVEYTDRARRLAVKERYSQTDPGHQFILQSRQREVRVLLDEEGLGQLGEQRILEVGSGMGGVLQEFISYGVNPDNVHGTDLLFNRLTQAQDSNPKVPITCANAGSLPYLSDYFDLVLQFTVFSSILDSSLKKNTAQEMRRVLKPQGAILWYDFWLNPTNNQTKGIRPREIRELFPGCRFSFKKITLAPPIARKVVPISWPFATWLESLQIFNSHYLALLRPF